MSEGVRRHLTAVQREFISAGADVVGCVGAWMCGWVRVYPDS